MCVRLCMLELVYVRGYVCLRVYECEDVCVMRVRVCLGVIHV